MVSLDPIGKLHSSFTMIKSFHLAPCPHLILLDFLKKYLHSPSPFMHRIETIAAMMETFSLQNTSKPIKHSI